MSQLFRKKAMERLSSPEQLDTLLHITSPGGWVGLAAAGFCILTALIWGIYGSIPFKVSGQGLLMNQGGIFTVQSEAGGIVDNIYVKRQDSVLRGQTLSILSQPDLESELQGFRGKLADLHKKYGYVKKYGNEESREKLISLKIRKTTIEFGINSYTERIKRLKKQVEDQKYLYKQGLITKSTLFSTMNQFDDAKTEVMNDRVELKNISSQIVSIQNGVKLQLMDIQDQIDDMENQISTQETKLLVSSIIKSPYSGIVIGLNLKKGAVITPGADLMTVRVTDDLPFSLEVVSFFNAGRGKKIHPGMTIQISPGNIDADRYGYALSIVTYVSEFPASAGGMQEILQNNDMVRDMLAAGPLVEVHSVMVPDSSTPSGFKWTSAKGPPARIQAGTYCYASAVVETRSPISLVVPIFKKYILGQGVNGAD